MTCPRCGEHIPALVVDMHFGDTSQMAVLAIGDVYPFRVGKQPQNGGPPAEDPAFGEGYAECPQCERDFHCVCRIEAGRLVAVEVAFDTPPYIPG